ncbi:hypothetical protein E4L95_02925 [Paracoccus liaowanqingii]|uniref:Alpha/beta hydrolase n=1 Tax=Paracoccus liaowanqingii TaxID=2560053 RepID=A0A4Z1CRR0_9RHOB|nr:hypothetical protein [Paracoccus liaowanqingii]TGN68022.1 hypothetical protein E4L95_02925 [Paracoccus liaowanqingii]
MAKNLLETSDIKITYHEFNRLSSKLIISFGHIGSGINEAGFGTDLSRSLGVNNIYVSQRVGTQYQKLSLSQFFDAVGRYVADKKSYAYGSSLGGYSALYFGGITNSKIISVSPINHAHPIISSPEFKDLEYEHLEIKDAPQAIINPIVLFDPHQKDDVIFMDGCIKPAYPDATYLSYPFAGHTIL